MFKRYTLSATRFPSQSFDETGCDYFLFPMPGKKDHTTINIHYSLEHHNGIHTGEVDLLNLKELNDLPSWYPFFHLPYQIDVKVTCTGSYVYVEIIYIDLSPNPELFRPTFTPSQVTKQYGAYTASPAKKLHQRLLKSRSTRDFNFKSIG